MVKYQAILLSFVLLGLNADANAFSLIRDDEAKLPAAVAGVTRGISAPAAMAAETRGISRGPAIKMTSPDISSGPVKGPFTFKVEFEARGGAKVDLTSVKVIYMKSPPVDLTERIRHGLSAGSIELRGAEVPPGEHQIQISLHDTDGRQTNKLISINATK